MKAPKPTKPRRVAENGRAAFRTQVLRLAATHYFPSIDDGVKELVDSLIRFSRGDAERGRRIIDAALRQTDCATPADFEQIAASFDAVPAYRPAWETDAAQCKECGGSGWAIVERDGSSGAVRCKCRKEAAAAAAKSETA